MKKSLLLFAIALMALVVGCEKESETIPSTLTIESTTPTITEQGIPAEGSIYTVIIESNAKCKVSTDSEGCTALIDGNKATITIEANEGETQRTMTVNFITADGTVTTKWEYTQVTKELDAPITGVELPTSDVNNPTYTGSPVTIKGTGFTAESEIWFRVAARSASDVKATVTAFTETSITFTAPDVEGSQSIVLKQDGKEQVLGEMFLAKELADAKLYSFRSERNETDGASTQIVSEVNKTTGELTQITTLTEPQSLIYMVAIGKTVYGMSGSETPGVVWFNTETKESGVIAESLDWPCLGIINGKLHALIMSDGDLSLAEINTETGAITEKVNFGALQIAGYNELDVDSDVFTYNSKLNTICIQVGGYSTTTDEFICPVVSLDLGTKQMTFSKTLLGDDFDYYFFERAGEIYINQSEYLEDIVDGVAVISGNSTIYKLNQTDLTLGDKITEFSDQLGSDLIYDEKDDVLYLYGRDNYFDTYSFTTKESKRINTTDKIGSFVMIR